MAFQARRLASGGGDLDAGKRGTIFRNNVESSSSFACIIHT